MSLPTFQQLETLLNSVISPALSLFICFITLAYQYFSSQSPIAKERLELAYHPLFLSVEPFLYKKVSYQDITPFIATFLQIEKDHSLLLYPSLRQHMHRIIDNKKLSCKINDYDIDDWTLICNYISNDYDKLCKRAHIPLRSTAYRLNYRQYSSKFRMIAGLFTLNLPPLIACSLVCWIFNPLFSILTTLLMFIFLVSYLADH